MSLIDKFLKPATETLPTAETQAINNVPVRNIANPNNMVNLSEVIAALKEAVPPQNELHSSEQPQNSEIPPTDCNSIEAYFAKRGVSVSFKSETECNTPVENLAREMAKDFVSCRGFIQFVREMIAKKKFKFVYSMEGLDEAESKSTQELLAKFGMYGIISNAYCNKQTNTISGQISTAPRVTNFINGDFLEYYARAVVERVVKDCAIRFGCDWELYSNVFVYKDCERHELDLVFRVGKHVFWSEVKSGKFSDFDCYRKIGILLDVNPNRHILLSADKSDEVTEAISWFYQFYVANIANFESRLKAMIENAFREDN